MKENRNNAEAEFEKELKKKMSDLSSNVDCFGKISARAFPERDQDFSDSELTVSDLENITGKHRAVPLLKWISAAAAAVVCIGVLPKTAFVQNFLCNLGRDNNKQYRALISEIKSETDMNTYKVYDMPLSDYIADDILVTPLYSCPFEDENPDEVNVRVYVRMFQECPTNQIYAVEYAGDFDDGNFLAAAGSKAKFTDKDFDVFNNKCVFGNNNEAYNAVSRSFSSNKYGNITDSDGRVVKAASFTYDQIFKDESGVRALQTQVVYSTVPDDEERYYYDTLTTAYDEQNDSFNAVHLPDEAKLWKCSLNFDGSDAMPKTRSEYFVNGLGVAYTTAYSACSKFINLFMQPSCTAGFAMSAFTSQNYGARKFERIREGLHVCLAIATISYVVLGSVMVFLPTYLARVMVSGSEPIAIAKTYLPICGVFLFAVDFLFIFRNGNQGFGKPLIPMISGIVEMALRIGVIALFIPAIGFSATAYAEASAWVGALILNMCAFEHTLRKNTALSPANQEKLSSAA